jgi:hypothetical protein
MLKDSRGDHQRSGLIYIGNLAKKLVEVRAIGSQPAEKG